MYEELIDNLHYTTVRLSCSENCHRPKATHAPRCGEIHKPRWLLYAAVRHDIWVGQLSTSAADGVTDNSTPRTQYPSASL